MLGSEYGWSTRKKAKKTTKIFGEDDFKFLVFICIFIFSLAGLMLLITSVFLKSDLQNFTIFAGENYTAISTFIIAVGAFILVVSCFGIYDFFNDINTIIYMYAFFLFLIITAQCAGSMSSLTFRESIYDTLEGNLKIGMENFDKEEQEEMTTAWNTVQFKMKCCGMENYTDWMEAQQDIPSSCYDQVN